MTATAAATAVAARAAPRMPAGMRLAGGAGHAGGGAHGAGEVPTLGASAPGGESWGMAWAGVTRTSCQTAPSHQCRPSGDTTGPGARGAGASTEWSSAARCAAATATSAAPPASITVSAASSAASVAEGNSPCAQVCHASRGSSREGVCGRVWSGGSEDVGIEVNPESGKHVSCHV